MTQLKILVFQVGSQHFGAEVRDVREVIPAPEVTALPKACPPVVGVFNLRGNVVTAVDGAQALGVRDADGARARAVVANVRGQLLGILVSAASEVLTASEDDLRPAPRMAAGAEGADLARGVVLVDERPIVILDLARFLAQEEGAAAAAENVATPEAAP